MKVIFYKIVISIHLIASLCVQTAMAQELPKSPVQMKIERVGGMTHIEFMGQNEWQYDLKQSGSLLELTMPLVDEVSLEKVKEFQSLLVERIEVENLSANKTQFKIYLNDDRIENFDYLTQKPNNLVIDLFVNSEQVLADIRDRKEKELVAQRKKEQEALAKINKTKGNRTPAFAEYVTVDKEKVEPRKINNRSTELPLAPEGPIEDLFDFGGIVSSGFSDDDLEAKVIEAKGNIYLRYPLLKLENTHLRELQSFHPDYEIRSSFSDENKQARNLLKLFNQKSFASFLKAKKIYKKTFPQSIYDEILYYVEADTWVELWKINQRPEFLKKAMDIYKMLIERYPDSKIAERTLIYSGLLAHNVGEFFVATKMLRRYLKTYPHSPFNNHIKIYLADSLAHLNNFDGARNVLNDVIAAGERDTAAEASYRLGDIEFLKQRFRRAERAYDDAVKKYPNYVSRFPNAVFNKAEAQFNLAEYPKSLETYKEFFQKYPQHSYSAFALTRIGELVDLLKEDKRKAQGFYNESFFRFRNSVGGTIARIRSLSQRFKDMKEKELEASVAEIKKREKAIDLHQVDEFSAFMISDGYYTRGEYLNAANTLINYFQVNPKPVNIKKFEKRISRAIAGEVRELLNTGDTVKALHIIESHQKSWLSKSRRVDVQLFRGMAYEKMDLFDEALDSYQRIEQRMKDIAGTKEERERKVFEYYPTFDQINLRQAVVQYQMGDKNKSLAFLNKVKKINELDPDSKVDFHFTLSQIAFDNKKYKESLQTANLVNKSAIIDADKRQKFNIFLSKVYEKNQQFDKAISILEEFHKKFKGEQDQVYVLSRLFQLYRSKGLKEKAIKTGEELIASYGNSNNLDKERYYLGELYFNNNNEKKAQRTWKGLTKKSMWEELANNKMVSGNWKKQTEEKMNRIPAMAK